MDPEFANVARRAQEARAARHATMVRTAAAPVQQRHLGSSSASDRQMAACWRPSTLHARVTFDVIIAVKLVPGGTYLCQGAPAWGDTGAGYQPVDLLVLRCHLNPPIAVIIYHPPHSSWTRSSCPGGSGLSGAWTRPSGGHLPLRACPAPPPSAAGRRACPRPSGSGCAGPAPRSEGLSLAAWSARRGCAFVFPCKLEWLHGIWVSLSLCCSWMDSRRQRIAAGISSAQSDGKAPNVFRRPTFRKVRVEVDVSGSDAEALEDEELPSEDDLADLSGGTSQIETPWAIA